MTELQAWAAFVLTCLGIIGAGWRWVVMPIRHVAAEFACLLEQMPQIVAQAQRIEAAVGIDGQDYRLPEPLRGLPLRALVVEHIAWSKEQVGRFDAHLADLHAHESASGD